MKKQIPNIITAARIALSAALIFTENFSALFYVLYFVCGMSDMADGFLAKKLDAESPFGSKLDSLADFIFVAVCAVKLWGYIAENRFIAAAFAVIAAVKLTLSIIFNGRNTHTAANKAAGFFLFVSVPFISALPVRAAMCAVAAYAAADELYHAFNP